jgi:hypothetical protein
MRYLLLIYNNEAAAAPPPPDELEVALKPWWDYQDWLEEKGWYMGGDALQRTHTATTVRGTEGNTITSDGPFAETKEQAGGFYVVDAADMDEALEYARQVPLSPGLAVEVRPIQTFE